MKSNKQSVTGNTSPPQTDSISDSENAILPVVGRVLVSIARFVPTALFGGVAAVCLGFYTDDFDTDSYGHVIADRFIDGAYFNVLAKVVFRFLLPLASGWNPGRIYGSGLQGAFLGLYFGAHGRHKAPIQCCIIVSLVSMIIAFFAKITC